MISLPQYAGQAVVYTLFAAFIGYFSYQPSYRSVPAGKAVINLSFAHGAKAKGGCRDRTPEELAKLPPNMRAKKICSRERLPVIVEFDLDGKPQFAASLPPIGVRGDGPSKVYRKFVVPSGGHMLAFRLRDTDRADGFDYVSERSVTLREGQLLSVDFDTVAGGFVYRNLADEKR